MHCATSLYMQKPRSLFLVLPMSFILCCLWSAPSKALTNSFVELCVKLSRGFLKANNILTIERSGESGSELIKNIFKDHRIDQKDLSSIFDWVKTNELRKDMIEYDAIIGLFELAGMKLVFKPKKKEGLSLFEGYVRLKFNNALSDPVNELIEKQQLIEVLQKKFENLEAVHFN